MSMCAVTATKAHTDYSHVIWPSTDTHTATSVQTPTGHKNTCFPDSAKIEMQIQTHEFSSTEH